MRTRDTILRAGTCVVAMATALLATRSAAAQTETTPPIVTHDSTWGTVSTVATIVGASVAAGMPRVYYADPESTVGWKGRWHFSVLAPAMTMTAATMFVDRSVKESLKYTRPSCNQDVTAVHFPGSGCESYGGPSTHAFAAWGAAGSGLGIFLVDTLRYSDKRFNVPYFIGEVVLPVSAALLASVSRGVTGSGTASYESGQQIAAGGATGFATGLLVGFGYAMFQPPNCGYGNHLFCW